jgi:RsiW-degrading membrane proteinase PrsW (M82 family)
MITYCFPESAPKLFKKNSLSPHALRFYCAYPVPIMLLIAFFLALGGKSTTKAFLFVCLFGKVAIYLFFYLCMYVFIFVKRKMMKIVSYSEIIN